MAAKAIDANSCILMTTSTELALRVNSYCCAGRILACVTIYASGQAVVCFAYALAYRQIALVLDHFKMIAAHVLSRRYALLHFVSLGRTIDRFSGLYTTQDCHQPE